MAPVSDLSLFFLPLTCHAIWASPPHRPSSQFYAYKTIPFRNVCIAGIVTICDYSRITVDDGTGCISVYLCDESSPESWGIEQGNIVIAFGRVTKQHRIVTLSDASVYKLPKLNFEPTFRLLAISIRKRAASRISHKIIINELDEFLHKCFGPHFLIKALPTVNVACPASPKIPDSVPDTLMSLPDSLFIQGPSEHRKSNCDLSPEVPTGHHLNPPRVTNTHIAEQSEHESPRCPSTPDLIAHVLGLIPVHGIDAESVFMDRKAIWMGKTICPEESSLDAHRWAVRVLIASIIKHLQKQGRITARDQSLLRVQRTDENPGNDDFCI